MDRRPDERIEVEPLAEGRWARVERSLFERLAQGEGEQGAGAPGGPPPHWRSPAVLVVAGAVAAAIGALASRGLWRSPAAPVASHIETGDSRSHLVIGEATIEVAPRSDLFVSGDEEHGVLLVLDTGGVDCEVAPRLGRPPFVVQAGAVRVRVVGTHFAVSRQADDGVGVDVTRGVVEVESQGGTERVSAGGHWPSEPAAPLQPPPAAVASAAVPVPSGSDEGAGPGRGGTTTTVRRAPSLPPQASASSVSTADAVTPAPPKSTPTAPSGVTTPTAQQRYEAAARLESSDPAGALASYRALSRDGNDAWSANALYAAARLQADRGARDGARALLEEYLARFPHGLNAPDARDMLERVRHSSP